MSSLTSLTLLELRDKAKSKKIKGYSNMTKKELINILKPSKHPFNIFFNKIYVINLKDKVERWKKVKKDFDNNNIKITRFEAIDGRCKGRDCNIKREEFKQKYGLRIARTLDIPPASLAVGTYLILKDALSHNYSNILICEDDVVVGKGIKTVFKKATKEIERQNINWDLLYLGCGGECGKKGMSWHKNKYCPYLSDLYREYEDDDFKFYVHDKDDIRKMCPSDMCNEVVDHIVEDIIPGGTWAYAYSRSGIEKMVEYIEQDGVWEHIDQMLMHYINHDKLKAISFDPPIMYHREALIRADTDINW